MGDSEPAKLKIYVWSLEKDEHHGCSGGLRPGSNTRFPQNTIFFILIVAVVLSKQDKTWHCLVNCKILSI